MAKTKEEIFAKKYQFTHCNNITEVVEWLNNYKPYQVISINNDERGNWWIFYIK